jgi:GAF domain-containing protein
VSDSERMLREEIRRLGDEMSLAQRQKAEIARELVVIERLHASLDRGQVLLAVEEILAALLGCEEFALLARTGGAPQLVHSVGLNALSARLLTPSVVQRVLAGEAWIAEDRGASDRFEPRLTACVPLMVEGRVTGALLLFRLLGHKLRLEDSDLVLLDRIGQHLGTALRCAQPSTGLERL